MSRNTRALRVAALVGPAVALLSAPGPGNAEIVIGERDGWKFSTDGNVNTFMVFESGDDAPAGVTGGTLSDDADSTRIRTGLLPAAIAFNITTPVTNGLTGGGRIGFYPQVQNAKTKNQFGAQIDLREAFFTVAGDFGQVLGGRALSLFLGRNILTDMTLFGVGVQGGVDSGGTTLGRIGYGYIYPQFNAQLRYTTPDLAGFKLAVGAFDPSRLGNAALGGTAADPGVFATRTDSPRFEFELSYERELGESRLALWLSGMYQDAEFDPDDPESNGLTGDVTAQGIGGGIQWGFGPFEMVASGFAGEGLGTTLLLDTDSIDLDGEERDNFGFLVQGSYTAGKTTFGVSYGENNADETSRDRVERAGGIASLDKQSALIFGVYHDLTDWFQIGAEYARAKNEWHGGQDQESDIVSVGGFFIW